MAEEIEGLVTPAPVSTWGGNSSDEEEEDGAVGSNSDTLTQQLYAQDRIFDELLKENAKLKRQLAKVSLEKDAVMIQVWKERKMIKAVKTIVESMEKQEKECKELIAERDTQISELTDVVNQMQNLLDQTGGEAEVRAEFSRYEGVGPSDDEL